MKLVVEKLQLLLKLLVVELAQVLEADLGLIWINLVSFDLILRLKILDLIVVVLIRCEFFIILYLLSLNEFSTESIDDPFPIFHLHKVIDIILSHVWIILVDQ